MPPLNRGVRTKSDVRMIIIRERISGAKNLEKSEKCALKTINILIKYQ
jgi:hypothetical protein